MRVAIAVVGRDRKVLAQVIDRQDGIHRPWKGIVPYLAAKGHERVIDSVIELVLKESGIDIGDLSAIAVTRGPGLSICLGVGVNKAKELSIKYGIPLIGVNHMEGHALIPRFLDCTLDFPYLALLVSGGHTQLLVVRGVGEYNLLGETLDVAIGDVFDKVARKLNLSDFNGGKELEKAARLGNPTKYSLPIPLKRYKNCDFSFSGIQTAFNSIMDRLSEKEKLESQTICDLASSFQYSIVKHLLDRTRRAIMWASANVPRINVLVVSGGVACNKVIGDEMKHLASEFGWKCIIPPADLCTDNGIMISWAGQENWNSGKNFENPQELYYIPKWSLDKSGMDYFPDTRPQRIIRCMRESKLIDKYKMELKSSPSLALFHKACLVSIGLKNFDEARNFLLDGLNTFPNSQVLLELVEKVNIKEKLHTLRFT